MKRLSESNNETIHRSPKLWLAALNGRRLPNPYELVAPRDEPERPIEVEFVGLSDVEQLRALAGFPGGRRFVLKRVVD